MKARIQAIRSWLRQRRETTLVRVVLVALLAGLLVPASAAVKGGVAPGHTTNPRPNPVIDPPDLD